MGPGCHRRVGVGRGNGQAHGIEHRQVRHVVAHGGDLPEVIQAEGPEQLPQRGQLAFPAEARVPDAEFGMRPAAFVEALAGRWEPAQWGAAVEAALPRFMRPVVYLEWPAEQTGMKPDRSALQREAVSRIGKRDA